MVIIMLQNQIYYELENLRQRKLQNPQNPGQSNGAYLRKISCYSVIAKNEAIS